MGTVCLIFPIILSADLRALFNLSHVFVVSECHVHTRVLVNEGALYSCGYSVFAPTRPGLTGFFVGLFVPWPFSPSPACSTAMFSSTWPSERTELRDLSPDLCYVSL